MNKQDIIKPLSHGISEITHTDENGIEATLMATIAPQHLPDDVAQLTDTSEHNIQVFNVNSERWETYLADLVIDVEQLTGDGAENNQNKLQASSEYIEQLNLFTDLEEDLDTMEHPDDE